MPSNFRRRLYDLRANLHVGQPEKVERSGLLARRRRPSGGCRGLKATKVQAFGGSIPSPSATCAGATAHTTYARLACASHVRC